jgi:hypothetical protein
MMLCVTKWLASYHAVQTFTKTVFLKKFSLLQDIFLNKCAAPRSVEEWAFVKSPVYFMRRSQVLNPIPCRRCGAVWWTWRAVSDGY